MSNQEGVSASTSSAQSNGVDAFEDFSRIQRAVTTLLQELEKVSSKQSGEKDVSGLQEQMRRHEIEIIKTALLHAHGNQRRAAKLLQINATTLNAKIKRFKIDIFDEE